MKLNENNSIHVNSIDEILKQITPKVNRACQKQRKRTKNKKIYINKFELKIQNKKNKFACPFGHIKSLYWNAPEEQTFRKYENFKTRILGTQLKYSDVSN